MQTFKELYIGGEWVAPSGSEVIEVISPASEEVIGQSLRQWKSGKVYVATKAQPIV